MLTRSPGNRGMVGADSAARFPGMPVDLRTGQSGRESGMDAKAKVRIVGFVCHW